MGRSHTEESIRTKQYLTKVDPTTREEIILTHLPLVHFVLGRLGLSQSMGTEYEDVKSQGLVGLIEAVDHYDPSHGTQFSTYATLRIRGRILDYLRSIDWLSRSARQRARTVEKAINDLWSILQRSPTDEELADYLGCDIDVLQQALIDANHVILSLDSLTNPEGENDVGYHEVLADEGQQNPADILDEHELKARLLEAIKSLPERQQTLLSLYYYENLTFKEIGEVLGISESRVCQLHARAIMDLRAFLSKPITIFQEEASFINLAKHQYDGVKIKSGRSKRE